MVPNSGDDNVMLGDFFPSPAEIDSRVAVGVVELCVGVAGQVICNALIPKHNFMLLFVYAYPGT